MDSNSMFSLMDLLILFMGVYVLYLSMKMKRTGKLEENMLMSKNVKINKCRDVNGYIAFMYPRQMLMGSVVVLCGAVGLIQDYTTLFGAHAYAVYMVVMVLILAGLAWYSLQSKKAQKEFWPD